MDKKGSRPILKPENGIDNISVKSVSDGEAQSVRSVCSAPSPRSNRCPSKLPINRNTNHVIMFIQTFQNTVTKVSTRTECTKTTLPQ